MPSSPRRTTIGRRIYAMGGNEKATQAVGHQYRAPDLLTFINMGVLAALAGLIIAARLNSATAEGAASASSST